MARRYRDHRGRFAVQPRDARGRFISRAAHAALLAPKPVRRTIVRGRRRSGRVPYSGRLNMAFVADVDAFFDGTEVLVDAVAAEATREMGETMQERCPYDTGELHGSFDMSKPAAAVRAGDIVEISYGAPYALFVHDGTSRQRAQPWVRETTDEWPDFVDGAAQRVGWSR